MTQFVFLLFENVKVPVDSNNRYKIEIHFSPGAKGREEIIASGESVNKHILDFNIDNVHLKRMLPVDNDDIINEKLSLSNVSENISLSNGPSAKIQKRTSKSLPTLMSKEELIHSKAVQNSISEEEEKSELGDNSTSSSLLHNDIESQHDNIDIEELCKLLFLLFQALYLFNITI